MILPNTLKIQAEALPFFNISTYQNGRSFIRSLYIQNSGDSPTEAVTIKIYTDSAGLEPFEYSLPYLPAQSNILIPTDKIKINKNHLHQLSESEQVTVFVEVYDQKGLNSQEKLEVDFQPLEHFGGFEVLPELIASYITPNHPYVYHIKRKAIEVLEKKGLPTAFEGYQKSDPERVLQVLSAIYTAIQEENIIYSSLAPGYEQRGQRLRLLHTIQKEQFANCIDISLLFGACLEAVDLNPILIILEGHAYVGCWLHDDKFPEIINDDKAAITKRLSKGIREIVALEATSVCKGNDVKFSDALALGESQLIQNEKFLLSVDIKRARTAFIRPLPLLHEGDTMILDTSVASSPIAGEMEDRFEIGTIYQDELLSKPHSRTKQKVWERNLLDLSLRNSLLNLRMTRNMLQIVDIDISHFEDTLSEGKSFYIMPSMQADVQKKYNLFSAPLHQSSSLFQLASEELKSNRLLTYYHQQDLDNILTYIHKNAKQAIEENGSSTLYLAVGLLKWFDKKTPEQTRYAPILLVPVEIGRRSVNSKFTLKSREEETMINITLVEFLRQEYELNLSALEQLPYDDKGVDVAKVMGILRRAVMQMKGWDVEEQLVLGNFSFNKLILWKDIVDYTEDLMKSSMVKSLIEGRLTFEENDSINIEDSLDRIASAELALPIPTDASQMEAVWAADQGNSFILHGPPGTGKSQTITNIIANALFKGKRVLFVAAKKAALDVVHKRLESIGLGTFSLELHSNKSKKSDVLEQLSQSIDAIRQTSNVDFEVEAQRLDAAKESIRHYVELLHKTQVTGWSLYDSMVVLEDYEHYQFGRKLLPQAILDKLNPNLWREWLDWLPQFQTLIGIVKHPSENPLESLRIKQYAQSLHEELIQKVEELIPTLEKLEQNINNAKVSLNLSVDINNKADLDRFTEVLSQILLLEDIPVPLFKFLAKRDNQEIFEEWIKLLETFIEKRNHVLKDFESTIFELNVNIKELEWKQANQKWFLSKWIQKSKIKKELALHATKGINGEQQIDELFRDFRFLKETSALLSQNNFKNVTDALGRLYKENNTDISEIKRKIAPYQRLFSFLNHWGGTFTHQWINQLPLQSEDSTGDIFVAKEKVIKSYLKDAKIFNSTLDRFENLSGSHIDSESDWIDHTREFLNQLQYELPNLKSWMSFKNLLEKGNELHLQWLIDGYYNKAFQQSDTDAYFQYTVHRSVAEQIIAKHEELSLFNAELFDQKVAHYKRVAGQFRELTIQELRFKLTSALPNTNFEAMHSSEIGILQRAIRSRGRGISIRRLFDQIPTLLPRVAPCMLMSPISVAQYFDVDQKHFDLVIFDEASQLPTCEAVSALSRAKQAIVVGDPKQMPPTSFFNTIKLDEDNMDVEDLESILDDCLSLSVPSKYLLRHYRSKHESLIAFSNANFYENKLLTFPSADDLSRKVTYQHVQGHYDKGKSRTNSAEANAIVKYISEHYKNEKTRSKSLGVVTFSQTQQTLVEDKLQDLYIKDHELEALVNENSEPLFVKNLENVQGDERDIILFSIGYAPDESGKMSMNFGPLNRNGGWRRLNVAVTRARNEMIVFATLKAEQIDLNRTASEGVAGLKAFLNFAEKGQLTIAADQLESIKGKNQLSKAVSKKLLSRGLAVKCDIGSSNFKVDLGIVHPDRPDEFILGVILDGHYYFNAKTSNDRELVMPSVLQALGWNIHRVWAMDWYENSNKIVDQILMKVESLRSNTPKEDLTGVQEAKVPKEEAEKAGLSQANVKPVFSEKIDRKRPYLSYQAKPISWANSESIYEPSNRIIVKSQMSEIVEVESPISRAYLFRKILNLWNINRIGGRLLPFLEEIIEELGFEKREHHQTFYWKAGSNFEMDHFRDYHEEKRSLEDVAPEEILVAMVEAIAQNLSLDQDELIRYSAKTFGFSKVGNQIDTILRQVIDLGLERQLIKKEGNRLKLC